MSERRRLHPITMVSNSINQLKGMFIPLIGLLVIGNKKESFGNWISVIIIGIVAIFVFFSGLVKWLRYTYRLEDGELRIEYGFLVKKKRYIPFERIQSLSFSEGLLQRPFGLVKVVIETAGSNLHEAEAELTAVKKSEAEFIERTINETKGKKHISSEENIINGMKHYTISGRDLFVMSATSGGIGVILSAIFALLSQLENVIPYKKVFREAGVFIHGGVILIISSIIVALLFAWVISILMTFIKYSNFSIIEVKNDLIISRGMLEKNRLTIPLNRIQAIRVTENPVRSLFGYTSVYIESAGGNLGDVESRNIMLLPMIKKKTYPDLLSRFLKDYHFQVVFTKAPLKARLNYLLKEIVKVALIVIILIATFKEYGLYSLVLLLYPFIIGHFRYHSSGWNINDQQLALRYRRFYQHTIYMRKNRIQSIAKSSTWIQQRKQLATVHATVKSTGMARNAVRYLEETDVDTIYRWYMP